MTTALELFQHEAERGLDEQDARATGVKLFATFLGAAVVAVGAAALSSPVDHDVWRSIAVVSLLVSVTCGAGAFRLDRRYAPDPAKRLDEGVAAAEEDLAYDLLTIKIACYEENEKAIRRSKRALALQAAAAAPLVLASCFLLPG